MVEGVGGHDEVDVVEACYHFVRCLAGCSEGLGMVIVWLVVTCSVVAG